MAVVEAELRAQNAPPGAEPGAVSIEEGIAWLRLDDPGERVNTLSTRLPGWFEGRIRPAGKALSRGAGGR